LNQLQTLSRRAEDYLRVIYKIAGQKSYARIRDIARALGVQPPTVVEMMKKLHHRKLVVYEKYGSVTLTSQGEEIAIAVKERHETFKKFLEIIFVPKDIALKDAHVLEHQLHPKTVLQFKRLVEFVAGASERPRFVGRWMEQFKSYCEKKQTST